jgi:pyridoxamine 5'-phosphate oxidase
MKTFSDPIERFEDAFARAKAAESFDVTAVALATASAAARPAVRMVLLKGIDARGFVFHTNYDSRKATDLKENPFAALCFYWPVLGEQVRVEGKVAPVSSEESDAYFATRPRLSQLGAWASQQSAPLASREELLRRLKEHEDRFAGQSVPRPSFWGGYLLVPDQIEFWKNAENRLHDREVYLRQGDSWRRELRYP